jgi:epoxyqueuosine reductase
MMSPQGILPKAKSVVVCAIHHPDACIELGGEISPHHQGPYVVQGVMNDKLDLISFKIARFLEAKGYQTVPIAASNIWRYMQYKELDAIFAPDISNIYSSVAAGLSEMGWHGIALTPEYGPRNRFVSIITEAPLKPDPLYNGPKLCDMCGECIRACPTDAYRKEVNGVKTIVIEGREYSFANKNLWRCSWAEHFGLDLDMEIPEKVDEDVIMAHLNASGLRFINSGSRLTKPASVSITICLKYI